MWTIILVYYTIVYSLKKKTSQKFGIIGILAGICFVLRIVTDRLSDNTNITNILYCVYGCVTLILCVISPIALRVDRSHMGNRINIMHIGLYTLFMFCLVIFELTLPYAVNNLSLIQAKKYQIYSTVLNVVNYLSLDLLLIFTLFRIKTSQKNDSIAADAD